MLVAGTALVAACGRIAPPQPRPGDLHRGVARDNQADLGLGPEAEGARPVVYMLHGINGSPQDMDLLGRTVAEQGYVVFALDWDDNADPY